MTQIVGFAGKKRSGKSTAAQYLESYGYTAAAFGDNVRNALKALDPWIVSSNGYRLRPERLSTLLTDMSWEDLKASEWEPSVREYMQRLGTEVGRDTIDPYIWIDLIERGYLWAEERLVLSDVRFKNEAEFIQGEGGIVIHLSRPNSAMDSHSSEQIDFECDHYVTNDSTLENLNGKLHGILSSEGFI